MLGDHARVEQAHLEFHGDDDAALVPSIQQQCHLAMLPRGQLSQAHPAPVCVPGLLLRWLLRAACSVHQPQLLLAVCMNCLAQQRRAADAVCRCHCYSD